MTMHFQKNSEQCDLYGNAQMQEYSEPSDNVQADECHECPDRIEGEDAVLETPADISDRYRFVRLLGQGTQGKVFEAVRLSDGISVAIKVLQIRSIQHWKEYDLFWREARTLKALQIEGVAQFYEATECLDSNDPHAYLVQQHIHGKSLSEMLKTGAHFSMQDIFLFAVQIVEILNQLHHHDPPIIHRDIKPSNIMLEPDGKRYRVYLTDFGAVYNPQIQKGGSTVAGTFGYMPPEQLMGHVTEASDIYALGVTLTELLSGISPSDMDVIDLRLAIEKPLENVPYPVVSLLRRMTMPKVEERLCDHDELLRQLRRFAQGDFSQVNELGTTLAPVTNLDTALKRVNRLGQKGNLDLWLALPEQTPRDIPKCYTNQRAFSRKSKLIDWAFDVISAPQKLAIEGEILNAIIIALFGLPMVILTFLACVPIFILGVVTIIPGLLMLYFLIRDRTRKQRTLHHIHTLLRQGRKFMATVVDIRFLGKDQHAIEGGDKNIPEYLVRYAFNPIDDDLDEQLIHEIKVTNAPAVSPGDSIPILYDIHKTEGEPDVVISMPFPIPVRRYTDLSKCYCRTRNGVIYGDTPES